MTDEYLPTRGGSFVAYEPQWLHPADGWLAVPQKRIVAGPGGVPYPLATGGILMEIDLCGKNQALAIAHAFAAIADATADGPAQVRIQPYQVHYDIKAKAMEDEPHGLNDERFAL